MLATRYTQIRWLPLGLAAVVSCALSCGGNVSIDSRAHGATSSTGGSSSIAPVLDAGPEPFSVPCNDYCCELYSFRNCTLLAFDADVRVVNMLLVVDKSATMNDPISAVATQSRWEVLKVALRESLPTYADSINFGLELFPYNSAGIDPATTNPTLACQLPAGATALERAVAAGASNLVSIFDLLDQQTPGGYSPTAKALNAAYDYYTAGQGSSLPGSKWVLLATSGASDCNTSLSCAQGDCIPNHEKYCSTIDPSLNCCEGAGYLCSDQQAVVAAIDKLANAGIYTYVVGTPIWSVEDQYLNQYAMAGRVPNQNGPNGESYYSVSSDQTLPALKTAFGTIITQLVTACDFPLSTTGTIDANTIQVVRDCQFVPALPTSDSSPSTSGRGDGWTIDYSQTPPHLLLVGTYCDSMMLMGAAHLDILLGCTYPP